MEINFKNILRRYPPQQQSLLPILNDLQSAHPQQYLEIQVLEEVAKYLGLTKSTVFGAAGYYSMFSDTSRGKYILRICASPVCNTLGSCNIRKEIGRKLHINNHETTSDGLFTLETVECLGHCDVAPAMLINDKLYGNLNKDKVHQLIDTIQNGKEPEWEEKISYPPVKGENRQVLKLLGKINPLSLEEYRKNGGMKAFEYALTTPASEIIKQLIDSGLKGRGGAGFPTGLKWKYTYEQAGQTKYIICNADEGEPGTFKDRPIMEELPFQYLEGLMIGAKTIHASLAYIYIRGEYTRSIESTQRALEILRQEGYLGQNIFGSGYSLDIKVIVGAGSYLCGDELTLIESMEGKRGNPRIKPPFPAEKGFLNSPTIVNNVETLANIPMIIREGSEGFKKSGTEKSVGTKIFTVSGDIQKPGYYEIEFGKSLSYLLNDLAGGVRKGSELQAVLIGGAAGTFIHPKEIQKIQLGYSELSEKGYVIGSGAVMVFDETRNMYDILYSICKFFTHESCGKCVPCRVGTTQLRTILKQLKTNRNDKVTILASLLKQAEFMEKTSLCALGQSPVLAIRTAIRYFADKL